MINNVLVVSIDFFAFHEKVIISKLYDVIDCKPSYLKVGCYT